MTESGKVAVVAVRNVGTNLVGDHASGVTALDVYDRSEFSETGGTLTVGAETYTYLAWDGEAEDEALDLTGATTAAYEDGTEVRVSPAATETVATVIIDDEGEGIEVDVPHELRPLLPEGIRTDGDGETVELENTADGWVLSGIVKETPGIDGNLILPGTIPDPSGPTAAPTDAPVVTVNPFSIGALLLTWPAVTDAQWYDVYASLTPGFDSGDVANRVLAGVTGRSATVASIDGVQIPMDGTPVYVVVKAANAIGAGPASSEVSGTARQADAEFLSALYGWFGSVEAQTAILGSLNVVMNVDVDGVISLGDRITIADPNAPDGSGGIVIWGDDAHTIIKARLHPDGNYLDGILVAQDITVMKALRLIGTASAIASGAKLTIENGVADPIAPSLTAGPVLLTWPTIPSGYTERGITWDATGGQWWQLLYRASDSRIYVRTIDSAGTASALLRLTGYDDTTHVNSIMIWSGSVYIALRSIQDTEPLWFIAKYSASTGGAQGRYLLGWEATALDTSPSTTTAAIGFDEINNLPVAAFVKASTPATLRLEWLTFSGGGVNTFGTAKATISSLAAGMVKPRSIRVSSFDRGTPLLQVESFEGNVHHWTPPAVIDTDSPTLVRQDAHYFTVGSEWLAYKGSGGTTDQPVGFYSSKADGKLSRWSSYFPAASEKWWAQYVDTGAAGVHTAPSPESASLAVPARRFAIVTLAPAPAGVTGADVYVGYGSTTPGTAKYKRTEALSARTMTLTGGKVTSGVQIARVITNKALTSNVATLTSAAHGLIVGDIITVAGVDSTFNGVRTVSAVTTNTFSYALVAANVASAASGGTATQGNTMGGSPGRIADAVGNFWNGAGVFGMPFLAIPKWRPGRWYSSQYFGENNTNITTVVGLAYYIPITVPNKGTIDEVGINVATLAASSTLTFGLYADDGGVPGARLVDWGSVSAASTGAKSRTGLAYSIEPGLYWLALLTLTAAPQVTADAAPIAIMNVHGKASITEAQTVPYHQTGLSALPAVAGSLATSTSISRPRVMVKWAA